MCFSEGSFEVGLQEHLNSIDPHIKFTMELPGTDGLPFLDTLTKPTPNSIESTVY